MRDYIRLFINGHEHQIHGTRIFATLADYLRTDAGQTGTKIVCAEGDCGACSVLLRCGDRFVAVNSCIQAIGQLDEAEIVTIEGIGAAGGHGREPVGRAVQDSMANWHGSQCGYCTPGFVVTMAGLFEGRDRVTEREVREGLTGNLCRCTGYEPIIKAACAIDAGPMARVGDLYPPHARDGAPVLIDAGDRTFAAPVTLVEAIRFKAAHPGCTIVQGGTDVGVWVNKRGYGAPALLSLSKIRELDDLRADGDSIVVGANVTLSQLEAATAERIPELHRLLGIFGSPQIRNAGTLIGNIANGSPIGDTLPYLFAAGAVLRLAGTGGTREVPVSAFYLGYKKFDLRADEIITGVRVPCVASAFDSGTGTGEILKLYKVSRRKDLDISAFTAAIRLQVRSTHIDSATIVYGGVAPVVMRLPETEAFLRGKPAVLATFREAGAIARREIAPISDVRGSRDYRLQLAENILGKFYWEAFGDDALAVAGDRKRGSAPALGGGAR